MGDVAAVLFYVGTTSARPTTLNNRGVTYGSLKDGDWFNSATGMLYPDGLTNSGDWVGRRYDRTPSTIPGKPYRSGPPNGSVSLSDVAVALSQVGDSCV
jgi:hypothetical protein